MVWILYWRLSFTVAGFVVYYWWQLLCPVYSPKNLRYFKEVEQNAIETIIVHLNIYMQKVIRPIHPWIHNIAYKWVETNKNKQWNGIIQTKTLSHPSPPHTHKTPSRPAFLRSRRPTWWNRVIYPQENRNVTKEKYKKRTYARYDEPVSYHQRR